MRERTRPGADTLLDFCNTDFCVNLQEYLYLAINTPGVLTVLVKLQCFALAAGVRNVLHHDLWAAYGRPHSSNLMKKKKKRNALDYEHFCDSPVLVSSSYH